MTNSSPPVTIPNPYHVLRSYGLRPKKSLGQNFLIDDSIPAQIAQAGGVSAESMVLEIGAGCGTLTHALAARAARVIAIEYDEELAPIAQQELSYAPHVEVRLGDVRTLDWPSLADEFGGPFMIYGNLPYYLSSEILIALLEDNPHWTRACFLVQLEFAQRVCAPPGTRNAGSISALTHLITYPSILFKVSADSFSPAPKVESAVIVLERRDTLAEEIGSMSAFRHVVRALFSQRRKMARRSLKAIHPDPVVLLESVGLNPTSRGEQLTLSELAMLTRAFAEGILEER
jgi:16S rRNA (adenine1518-N6/adenine1519-N6)-dimethyltransferase